MPNYGIIYIMIQILREITDWGDQQISNGDYYVNSHGYLIGYMPQGKAYKEFKKPISVYKRKFFQIVELILIVVIKLLLNGLSICDLKPPSAIIIC